MLAIALLMFPQIAQTLYSPALADIGQAFAVGPQAAAQTLSVYFLAFAVWRGGVGPVVRPHRRRPSMLAGLALYAGASVLALERRALSMRLLMAQALAAFGAAVGSVVTQTVLRDRFKGAELAQVFSLMGIALAASPAIGLFTGASLVQAFGYRGVLGVSVAVVRGALAVVPAHPAGNPAAASDDTGLFETLWRMLRDLRYLAFDAAGRAVQRGACSAITASVRSCSSDWA